MVEHILRRMGFGASAADVAYYGDLSPVALVNTLLDFERVPDDVDAFIGQPDYAGITTRGQFQPNTVIGDARQRWLFRMIHTRRPLQEKLALFWHNHFSTAYRKINGALGSVHATKAMDGRATEVAGGARGHIQVFRDLAAGNFRDLLVEVAKDPAMLVWLDNRTNVRTRPQENFARELMELFTIGLGEFTEADVYAAARVFTGWNLQLAGDRADALNSYYRFVFNPNQHDAAQKTFSFAVYPGGGRTIPARAAADGLQDGLDLLDALARHPATAMRLARRFYEYFVNDVDAPDEGLVREMAQAYLAGNLSIKAMLRRLFLSDAFLGSAHVFRHYTWPVEFVVRAIKETGWRGFSVDAAMTPLVSMGQQLYEPPNVGGWSTGGAWFSTASMLARMNFAATLAGNQRASLARDAQLVRESPDRVLEQVLARYQHGPFTGDGYAALRAYMTDGITWTGADAQLTAKAAGAARLVMGSGEYQFS